MRAVFAVTIACFFSFFIGISGARATPIRQGVEWPEFGWNVSRSSAPSVSMGIRASELEGLHRRQVVIDGVADSSAIYLRDATVDGTAHDVFFLTTTYGKTLAIDARSGRILWEFTPPSYASLAGTAQITTATPALDPDHRAIYAASPDGVVRKLAVANGGVEWATAITRLPLREKIASPLVVFHGRVIATTGGYFGDTPPYQGHVAVLDARSGRVLHVWNALCAERDEVMEPATCPKTRAAIWGRAGAVIDPQTGDIFVATGNGPWDGVRYFGDSVIELNANATRILGNYTPLDTHHLDVSDLDVGSTSPVLPGGPYVIQGGKDGLLRVLDWRTMRGASPHRGGALSRVPTPGSEMLFTAPAVWHEGGETWIFVADGSGTEAFTFANGALDARWHNHRSGTSPVIADGMAFVYDPSGGLYVYDATSGAELARLPCGPGHWNSPIVVDGRIALPEGNGNRHQTRGVFDIWSVGLD